MLSEIFSSWTRRNGTKFSRNWKVEFKKSFELYRQILLNVLLKVGINFLPFGTFVNAGTNALAYFPPPSALTKKKFYNLDEIFWAKKVDRKEEEKWTFFISFIMCRINGNNEMLVCLSHSIKSKARAITNDLLASLRHYIRGAGGMRYKSHTAVLVGTN